jgi:lipoteichoic acid synthase
MFSMLFSGKEIPNLIEFIGFKFLNHFFTILFIFLLFFPLYYLLPIKKKKLQARIIKAIFAILVIIEFSLTKYSLTTLLNLGADLLGYSLDDIYITVTASESTSVLYFIPFLIFPALFLVSCFFLKKLTLFKYSGRIFIGVTVVVIIIIIIMKVVFSNLSEANYQNKIYYFVTDVIKLQVEKSEIESIKLYGNNEYPFLKPSDATPDVLGSFFNTG